MRTPLIEWRDEFSVGVPEVDYEHQELVRLINELFTHISTQGQGPEVLGYLGEIYARISAHFALEEKVMRAHDYDHYQAHKQDHEILLDELRDIMDDYEMGKSPGIEQLAEKLTAWFVEHFKKQDARLHKHLGQ